jgi:hypothetical protein
MQLYYPSYDLHTHTLSPLRFPSHSSYSIDYSPSRQHIQNSNDSSFLMRSSSMIIYFLILSIIFISEARVWFLKCCCFMELVKM